MGTKADMHQAHCLVPRCGDTIDHHDSVLLHRLVRDMAALAEAPCDEIARLRLMIRQLQRAQYGRRSERLDPGQLALALE